MLVKLPTQKNFTLQNLGPQLNNLLANANINPEYHDGIRVTDPKTLEIARQVFQEENLKLVEALEKLGKTITKVI